MSAEFPALAAFASIFPGENIMSKVNAVIIGSGNIGTDLMIKISKRSAVLQNAVMVGIDPDSDGLKRAREMGIATTHEGIDGLVKMPEFADVQVVFDATSAGAHKRNAEVCRAHNKQMIDLTPAALGPYVVPVVNMDAHMAADNVNMVTCGGQATIPMVAAISQVAKVHYAEIVASIASKSAGPGTRANIDEFTETTARGLEVVGGASKGKAIIVMNPAEPPMLMRDTVFCLSDSADEAEIEKSVSQMVEKVQAYVPGYRLKQRVQFEHFGSNRPLHIPGYGEFTGLKSSLFMEVEGAGDYLPPYAGNLDIMTSAALGTAEMIVQSKYMS
jgi:acetaldehyde dehydrogenase